MSTAIALPSRVGLLEISPGRVRVVVDGEPLGPVLTKRAGRVVQRWLSEGALEESEGSGSKLMKTLGLVDQAADAMHDLLKNGLG